jgi:hypothetical protein
MTGYTDIGNGEYVRTVDYERGLHKINRGPMVEEVYEKVNENRSGVQGLHFAGEVTLGEFIKALQEVAEQVGEDAWVYEFRTGNYPVVYHQKDSGAYPASVYIVGPGTANI